MENGGRQALSSKGLQPHPLNRKMNWQFCWDLAALVAAPEKHSKWALFLH
jgi:hypothetical protein